MSINFYKYSTITIGVAMVFLAEKPDEYFYKIRLESIHFAVVAQLVVGLIAFAYFYFTPGYPMENISRVF